MGHCVALGIPGKLFDFGCLRGVVLCTLDGKHDVKMYNSGIGFVDMERLWADAHNMAARGEITHFAMLHSDINPEAGWLDMLLEVMDERDADLVSAVCPIKDNRGLTSTGIGDACDPWVPCRRFTVRDLADMPDVFNAAEAGYPGRILLHNTGCWVADLRKPLFFETDDNGELIAHLQFRQRIIQDSKGEWGAQGESEDWFFSRALHMLNANTFIARKVALTHRGPNDFPNNQSWGEYTKGDEDTRHKWDRKPVEQGV